MSNSLLSDGLAKALGNEDGFEGVEGLNYEEGPGGNVFVGTVPPRPNRCVTILPSGGFEADSGLPYDEPTIQVIVRGDEDARWALSMWDSVYDVVQGLAGTTLPNDIYVVSMFATQSGPIHIGKDDSGRVQYGMNLTCEIHNPTRERPL